MLDVPLLLENDAEASGDALRAHVKQELSAYKVPRHVFVYPDGALPFTDTGKIDKRRLQAELTELNQTFASVLEDTVAGGRALKAYEAERLEPRENPLHLRDPCLHVGGKFILARICGNPFAPRKF